MKINSTLAFELCQILIELETALLDDEPHWYKLQTHDVSSIPLPRASPNAQRRQLHGESPTRRLQSKKHLCDRTCPHMGSKLPPIVRRFRTS